MSYLLFDDVSRSRLLPFTHTRPVADIRCGILTMRERWEKCLHHSTSTLTQDYLQPLYPANEDANDNIYINGGVFANSALVNSIKQLEHGQALVKGDLVIAARISTNMGNINTLLERLQQLPVIHFEGDVYSLKNVWDLFSYNDRAIKEDYTLLTAGRTSNPIPVGVWVSGKENLFIEPGAVINPGCIINANTGPVYIGKDAELLEGVLVRGPLAVCEHGVIKMGAKIYGATTIGPGCKVGGEINNTVFFANSNKGHDGYLGNAVIGEWCNLGADTNCSNLKNNYDEVKIWSEQENKLIPTGITFCGLLMGDHSKCGINTMFNTGTVVGVSCNIFGAGFPEKFVPSFSWGGSEGMATYAFDKAMETAARMMGRRGKKLSPLEIEVYRHIFTEALSRRK